MDSCAEGNVFPRVPRRELARPPMIGACKANGEHPVGHQCFCFSSAMEAEIIADLVERWSGAACTDEIRTQPGF